MATHSLCFINVNITIRNLSRQRKQFPTGKQLETKKYYVVSPEKSFTSFPFSPIAKTHKTSSAGWRKAKKSRLCRENFSDYKSLLILFPRRHHSAFHLRDIKRKKSCLRLRNYRHIETAYSRTHRSALSTGGFSWILWSLRRHKIVIN